MTEKPETNGSYKLALERNGTATDKSEIKESSFKLEEDAMSQPWMNQQEEEEVKGIIAFTVFFYF